MPDHWRCTRCGTFHGSTSRFQGKPETCRECGHGEFETLGTETPDDAESALSRALNLDAFTWMALGVAIYNVVFALLGGFANEPMLMYSAGASFIAMVAISYLLTSRSKTGWTLAVAVFAAVVVWGALIVLPRFVGAEALPDYGDSDIFFVYGVLYLIFGLIGLAMLYGGRGEIESPEDAADELSRRPG